MELEGECLEVGLDERAYEIVIGRGLAFGLRQVVDDLRADGYPVAAVVDEGFSAVQKSFLEEALGGLPKLELPSGETTKTLATIGRV